MDDPDKTFHGIKIFDRRLMEKWNNFKVKYTSTTTGKKNRRLESNGLIS